jgi:hypothetical protein
MRFVYNTINLISLAHRAQVNLKLIISAMRASASARSSANNLKFLAQRAVLKSGTGND